MKTIYALTRKKSYTSGRGCSDSVTALGTIEKGWSFVGYHPLFESFEAASEYRDGLDEFCALNITELSLH